jgi:hypothetical protein
VREALIFWFFFIKEKERTTGGIYIKEKERTPTCGRALARTLLYISISSAKIFS